MKIDISQIIPDPDQPRKTFKEETLQELKGSYDKLGLIQPITVRPCDGKYQIVIGERRYRASLLNGQKEIECIVREDIDDKVAREMQFAENSQQENVPPLESGRAFLEHRKLYGMSQEELAKTTGIKRWKLQESEALLAANNVVQSYVQEHSLDSTKGLDASTAYEISTIKNESKQSEVAKATVEAYLPGAKEAGLPRSIVRPIVARVKDEPNRSVKDIVEEIVYGQPLQQPQIPFEPTSLKLTGDSLILMTDYQRILNNLDRIKPYIDNIPSHAKKALYLKGVEVLNTIHNFNNKLSPEDTPQLTLGGG